MVLSLLFFSQVRERKKEKNGAYIDCEKKKIIFNVPLIKNLRSLKKKRTISVSDPLYSVQ